MLTNCQSFLKNQKEQTVFRQPKILFGSINTQSPNLRKTLKDSSSDFERGRSSLLCFVRLRT
ncbi:hypothetical protein QQP08_003876 [Theobroma cacao]|nr:hypothetical protein QQP08_003876 [Theobroma cacao]